MLDAWIAARMELQPPLTRKALEEKQLERINRTLAHAVAHSAFYRERFPVSRVKSLEEFSSLPFTCPEDVKAKIPRQGIRQ